MLQRSPFSVCFDLSVAWQSKFSLLYKSVFVHREEMCDFEDYSEEIWRRKEKLSEGILSCCVTNTSLFMINVLSNVYNELTETCLVRDWRKLAGKLLKPPPTSGTIEKLSKSANPACELLKTWVSTIDMSTSDGPKTFDSLIETMVECKLYSACDELLDFLQNSPLDLLERQEELAFSDEVEDQSNETSEYQQNSPSHRINEQNSSPSPEGDEIFIVCSRSDNKTQAMKNLTSFVSKLEPVKKGELKVRSIHDTNQNSQVTTAWLEERVNRARYVILCFSSDMKAITERASNMPQFKHQMDYNLKFTMDFLVTGKIYENGCRNPKGKFIPVLLHGHDMSTLILPLRHFLHFSWPNEKKRITKYIMNLPEKKVPCQGRPKRLVRRELLC